MRTELDINAPLDHPFPESINHNTHMQSYTDKLSAVELLNQDLKWKHAAHYDPYPPTIDYNQIPAAPLFNYDFMIAQEKIKAENRIAALKLAFEKYKQWDMVDSNLDEIFELASQFEKFLNKEWKTNTNSNNQQT